MANPPQDWSQKRKKLGGQKATERVKATWGTQRVSAILRSCANKAYRPGPGMPGAEQAIARAKEVVGGVHVVCGVGEDPCRRARASPIDHFPSVALMPSHTAPTNPVTVTVRTTLKM